ncbi:MAG TPA: polymorphic toxin type 15 domain-containing protein [Myxococcaceae bacterium]|nr:polymorphic toxin type 15 domain-containing protein [Myxococcaceae bacterium]
MPGTTKPERDTVGRNKKARSAAEDCPHNHWVELDHGTEYVADHGQFEPAANTPFRITFGDGSQIESCLNQQGFARFDGIPAGKVQVEYEPDIDKRIEELKKQLKQYLDELIQAELEDYQQIEKELEDAKTFGIDFIGSNSIAKTYKYGKALIKGAWNGVTGILEFAWGLLKGAGKATYELSLRVNPLTAPQKFKEDLQKLKSAHQELQRFADEDLEAYAILMGDSEVHKLLMTFGKEFLSAQHSLELTETGGEVLFDVLLTIFTAGAGATANVRHAGKLKKLKEISDRLVDLLKRKKRRQRKNKDAPDKRHTTRIQLHQPKCFCPYGKSGSKTAKAYDNLSREKKDAFLKEYDAQLRRQQDAINDMTVEDYLKARDKFETQGRHPDSKRLQRDKRTQFRNQIWENIYTDLLNNGVDETLADRQATERTSSIMKGLDALHEPDQVAGGWDNPDPKKMGSKSANRSIGGSWKENDRLNGIDRQAEQAKLAGQGKSKMNIKLTVCRGRGQCP